MKRIDFSTIAIAAIFVIAGLLLLSWAAQAQPEEDALSRECLDCHNLASTYCARWTLTSRQLCENWYIATQCDDVCEVGGSSGGGGGGGWITSDLSQIKSDLNYTPGDGCGQIATVGYIWRCGFDCQQDKQSCVNHCSTQSSVNGWTASQLVDCENDCDDDYDDCMEDCL